MGRRANTARAMLEIGVENRSPVGVLTSEDGARRLFSGWMEFARTIEDWHAEARGDVDADRTAAVRGKRVP